MQTGTRPTRLANDPSKRIHTLTVTAGLLSLFTLIFKNSLAPDATRATLSADGRTYAVTKSSLDPRNRGDCDGARSDLSRFTMNPSLRTRRTTSLINDPSS